MYKAEAGTDEIRALIRAIAQGKTDGAYAEIPAYCLLKNYQCIWRAVTRDLVSLSQLQRVAPMAGAILASEGVPELMRGVSVRCFFNFIEQHGYYAYILGNTKIQHQIKAQFMDISRLSSIEISLLAINDAEIEAGGLSIGQVLRFAEALSKGTEKEAMSYLQGRASPKTPREFDDFTQLIMEVQKRGIGAIWHNIEDSVANLMLSDFVTLYCGDDDDFDPDSPWSPLLDHDVFTKFETIHKDAGTIEDGICADYREHIELGQQVVLGDLSALQAKAQNTRGYSEYLRRAIFIPKTVFFDLAEAALYHHRHTSPEAQRAFDRQYGLVVATTQ